MIFLAKMFEFSVTVLLVFLVLHVSLAEPVDLWTEEKYYGETKAAITTEHSGGIIADEQIVFSRNKSPYLLKNDLIIERNAELVIEPGVEIKVVSQIGITVRGTLTAIGNQNERIILTSAEEPYGSIAAQDIRLVDGPSILAGRVQIKHNDKWRSVCTNSKNWTLADMSIACRQLGFQGGEFFMWHNREMPLKSRLLYENPRCRGSEETIFECDWHTRQMGSGVCDYHPDLAIRCLPRHESPKNNWRGIRFENARHEKILTLSNTLFVPTSNSRLQFVDIQYAGSGRDHNASSALEIIGVPPIIDEVQVLDSAFNGINVTSPEAPFTISNSRIRANRGFGIFVNSSYGSAHINKCTINENGGDGIRYVHNEERPDERIDKTDISDFCTLATAASQTYPIQIFVDQSVFTLKEKTCSKVFSTRYGNKITIHFLRAETERNNSAQIDVFDGSSVSKRLLTSFLIRNGTRPQSVTSFSNQIYIKFRADPKLTMFLHMRLTSGLSKSYDLNVTNSDISENEGRGIAFDNLRTQLHIHDSSISKNRHVAGVHVTSGVGDINVTSSKISFNEGDGINITYTGGNRNISRSSISSNQGYGVAIWLNQTKETEYLFLNQSSVVEYTEVVKNLDVGILHGNYCSESYINITGNVVQQNLNDALEILSCWMNSNSSTKLQIGHNQFIGNQKMSIKISPALNLDGYIEFNSFKQGLLGQILIKNKPLEEFNFLKTNIHVQNNYFLKNLGVFVVNLALSPYSETQHLLFTKNFVKENIIQEPFQSDTMPKLNPRSRVAAPLVIGSNNVKIYRNIIENPGSKYEIGSHLEDQSRTINCTYNWLGFTDEEKIFHRIFHRNDRYNLAKIIFVPYLLHNSHALTSRINMHSIYLPHFIMKNSNVVGGEIEGEETLPQGEYLVERDINIRPGGKLTLEPGVSLKFPPSIGVMIGGKLEARGIAPDSIRFTLKEEIVFQPENDTYEIETEQYNSETEIIEIESKIPIRLLGGKSPTEGRLQVKVNNNWGTVCNYGWTIKDASLVCQQLGYTLNPQDWFLERNQIPEAGLNESPILSNVQCTEYDTDLTKCRAEIVSDFENSCNHDNDVGIRCYETSWAGLRFGVLSERSDLQFITIEKAGLLDYTTSTLKPALQIDFARHNFENIKVTNNYHDGLGIMYSDIYAESVNVVKNSEFSNNRGAGISFKQLGLKVSGSLIENNHIGIKHNPAISSLEQRELAGWFQNFEQDIYYRPFMIPHELDHNNLMVDTMKYLVTSPVFGDNIKRSYRIRCDPGYVIAIQLLNPIHNQSSESIMVYDSQTYNDYSSIWSIKRDLTIFPTTSSSHGLILDYNSGSNSLGGTVIILSSIRAPIQDVYNKIVKGPIPSLSMYNTKIRQNYYGIEVNYYNRYFNELGDHFLRKSNDSMKLINCDLSHNIQEAIYINSPHWDLHKSNISEFTLMINNSLITDNGKGIYHFSRDLRSSNNLFHYILQDDTIERNKAGGFDINLPYVWNYNENFTHSVYFNNNTWKRNNKFSLNIDGHFALVNITKNKFVENLCKDGLISFKGMEKKMLIDYNEILGNNGKYMVEFKSESQSEILGDVPAKFMFNLLKENKYINTLRTFQIYRDPTSVIHFNGIQKIKVNRNLFNNNFLNYLLVAGIKTAKLDNNLDVSENWWGTNDAVEIEKMIFDFDDWNNHAVALFRPYLMEEDFLASHSLEFVATKIPDLDNLGGRLEEDLFLPRREYPYKVLADLTVMPKATLTIAPGAILEFGPNVGILVLGTLKAEAFKGAEIIMRPISRSANLESNRIEKRDLEKFSVEGGIRLCKGVECLGEHEILNEGFLEYFNKTTLQWVPMCDSRFTERNAQVVCRELGFDSLSSFFEHDRRIEFHSNSLTRIWSWPEPLQCSGTETKYEDCPLRLNGQQYGHFHKCSWDSKFVFVRCEKSQKKSSYWGGIRFANSEFESHMFENRYHDIHTHQSVVKEESKMIFVKIIGAGILHNEKSPAIQSIIKSPIINYVNVTDSAFHGINFISPAQTLNLLSNHVKKSLGIGISVLSLTGEGREAEESSYTPLKNLNIPYNLFSLIDICDTTKEIRVEERVLIYYKYDNHPVNCVKIFKSAYNIKPFGFRLLQFNLFNSTNKYGIPDFISLYDGEVYNVTSKLITQITTNSHNEKRMFKSKGSSLSIKFFANGASSNHGFIAEVVTLPISAIGFNRDVQHNITYSVMEGNREGGLVYNSAGEVNPVVTIDKNQFKDNCLKLYGNFTTCKAAVDVDVQNTQTVFFRNNLVSGNQGGLSIKADSRGSATSLKGTIENNLFVNNSNLPALYVEGRQSSPYQEVTISRNYFTRNVAQYENNIVLKQVVSIFTYNYVKRNIGMQNLEVSGFDKVRLPIYQTTSHNGFYNNYALTRDSKATIVAGTAGQRYIDNIFFNPDNDYEIMTVNRSFTLELWKTKIDASYNYWGVNTTLAVSGRIWDQLDDPRLLEVNYQSYYMNNETILEGKCPPGWALVGDTCYIYIGAPMNFYEARAFCQADNASMPFLVGNVNYLALYDFIRRQQQWYLYSDKVWIQHIDMINSCTYFSYQSVENDDCLQRYPFVCEIDPKVFIDPLVWRGDIITIGSITASVLALLLLSIVIICWWNKSKYRHAQRLERRNSIRQSLHSLRSVGSAHGFSELNYRRKPGQLSTRSTDTLTKNSDYRKMVSNGSIDSMEKSTYNSSIEDTQSYDMYEPQNPNPNSSFSCNTTIEYHKPQYAQPNFNLAYKNEGFKDNSTFASNSRAASVQETTISDDTPIVHSESAETYPANDYYHTDTLPLNRPNENNYTPNFLDELKSKMPVQETSFEQFPEPTRSKPVIDRSKSEALLETNFDYDPEEPVLNQPIREFSRSKSQPLETAM
ncbi:PREDICTED: protein bark beetle isoform X2 [Nicrophorus vespilloides]|uniref:Protein bark beetle isoform X2 n=1 Tax=Nicrophorus vespilloides TaxID=110193 RepID=A0ABM1MHI8_NICVS|nr:PREDICTED: protein bark beetle isoform X2 [Nicrophorus vespilloides]